MLFLRRVAFLILTILLFLPGPSSASDGGPVVWFFSAHPDRYFPAFFEVHLKRTLDRSSVQYIDLYSPSPQGLGKILLSPNLGSAQLIILLDFNRELAQTFFQNCQNVSFQQKPWLIAFNCDLESISDQFHLIPVQIQWESVYHILVSFFPDRPSSAPIVFLHQNEPLSQIFFSTLQSQFPNHPILNQIWTGTPPQQSSLIITSNALITQELLDSQPSQALPLICLEASADILSNLQSGHLTAALDLKPSHLAVQIADLLAHPSSSPTLTLTPQLIFPDTLSQADAYEVLCRCFMCNKDSER